MTLRNETITYGDFVAPSGTVVDAVIFTYTDSQGKHQGVTLTPGAQPPAIDLAPETYTATAQAINAVGGNIGPAATDTFVIAAPTTITVSIPVTLSGS